MTNDIFGPNTEQQTPLFGFHLLCYCRPVNSKLDWNDILAAIFEAK